MKKFLAIVFALVFALSAVTTAFAAANICPHCKEEIESESDYNKHLKSECPELSNAADNKEDKVIYYCPYEGCGAKFTIASEYKKHVEETCLCKTEPTFLEKVEDFFVNFDINSAIDTVEGLLSKVDFEGLLIKVIDLLEKGVTAIIGAI